MGWKEEVLARVKPTKEEEKELEQRISVVLKRLNKVLGDATAVLGGSGAKGTWLRGQHDADVFVLFPYEKYEGQSHRLADILEKRLKKVVKKYERLYGSRDYFRFREKDFIFEIVPILKISKARDAVNITDVSPLHAGWVRKKSKGKISDEIRLVKAFCRAQKCYGAESYIRGLSGYVLEILTIHYGSFEKFLRAARKWEEKQIIDAGKLYGRKENVWLVVNKAKLHSPLIVIDPVDRMRNAAAALSREKWLLFKERAAMFLKKPSARFFERGKINLEKLKKRKGTLVWMEVESIKNKEDVAGAKLLLAFQFLKKKLNEFSVVMADWDWDKEKKAVFWYMVKKKERPKFEVRKGPPLTLKHHVKDFKRLHKKTVTKQGKIWAKVPIKEYKLADYVKSRVKENYFKEKVKKINKINVF